MFILGLGVIAALNQIGVATTVTTPVLIAVLATIAGILIVGVGGGLIRPMQSRWERWLTRAEQESQLIAEHAQAYRAGRRDAEAELARRRPPHSGAEATQVVPRPADADATQVVTRPTDPEATQVVHFPFSSDATQVVDHDSDVTQVVASTSTPTPPRWSPAAPIARCPGSAPATTVRPPLSFRRSTGADTSGTAAGRDRSDPAPPPSAPPRHRPRAPKALAAAARVV